MNKIFDRYRTILIDEFKVTPESFDGEFAEHEKQRGSDSQSQRDFIWRCFNELLGVYSQAIKDEEEMYRKQKEINMKMWEFLREEGRSINTIRKQVAKLDLLIYRASEEKSNFQSQVIIIGNKCCPQCDKIDKRVLEIKEAIDLQILPYSECTKNGGCICCYGLQGKRDSNGRLIMKKSVD